MMTRGEARSILMARARTLGVEDRTAGRPDRRTGVNAYTFADRLGLRVGVRASREAAFDLAAAYGVGYTGGLG